MIPTQNSTRGLNNVTSLDDARRAKDLAKQATTDVEQDDALAADSLQDTNEHGNRRFDAEKVARIKAAIAAGEYKIDATRVANKFIEHDRNQ